MKGWQLIFRIYAIFVMLFMAVLIYINYDNVPTISEIIVDKNHVTNFFFLNIAVMSLLFFIGFCCGYRATLAHYLLIPIVILINIFDCNNHKIVHYILFLSYIFLVFWIIFNKHPPIYCLVFLLVPFIAMGGLGFAEVLFFILVSILI